MPAHLGEEVEAAQAAHDAVHLGQALPFPFWLKGNSNSSAENRGARNNPAPTLQLICRIPSAAVPPTLMTTKVLEEHPVPGAGSCPEPILLFLGTIVTLLSASQGLAPPRQHRMGDP